MHSQTSRLTPLGASLSRWVIVLAAMSGASTGAMHGQRATTPAGKVCRSYSTDETRVTVGSRAATGTLRVRCKYDKTTNQHVCHEDFTGASSYSFVQTTQFASIADFVGDPSKVTFFPHAATVTVSFPGSTSTQLYSYDGRGYLTTIATASTAGSGGSTVQRFSAWDAIGRPTAGRDESQNYIYTYDDAQRVFTMKGSVFTITLKVDADANHVSSTSVGPTGKDTTTITTNATEQVCR